MRAPLLTGLVMALIAMLLSVPAYAADTAVTGGENSTLVLYSGSTLGAHYDAPPVALDGHFQILRDPTGRASLADIMASPLASRFMPVPALDLGFAKDAVWLRWTIRRGEQAQPWWLIDIVPATLDDVRIYRPRTVAPEGPADYEEIHLGRSQPLSARPIFHSHFLVPFPPSTTDQTFYARIRTNGPMLAHISVETPAMLIASSVSEFLTRGAFFGIVAVLVILNLIYWALLRRRVYLSCALYGIAIMATYLSLGGFSSIFLFPNMPVATSLMVWGGVGGGVLAAALFAVDALELEVAMPWAARVIWVGAVAGSLGSILTLLSHDQEIAALVRLIAAIISLFVCIVAALLVLRGRPAAGIFAAAFTIHFVGLTVTTVRGLGLMPSNFATDNAYAFAFLVTLVLANVGIGLRLKTAEADREQAHSEAIAVSQHAEERAVHLVEERTQELGEAKARAERALEAERRAVTEQIRLADMLAHEYRTPLATIRGNLDILRMVGSPDRMTETALSRMEAAASRLTDIIEVAIRDRGASVGARLVERDLRATVNEALAAALDAHDGRNIAASLPHTPLIMAHDERLLRVAIANIVDNAFKYSDTAKSVAILLRREVGEAVIQVADQGIGIPKDEIDSVFKRYYRSTTTVGREGFGLGLHLTERIIEAHGGRIRLLSTPQAGTLVTVSLPLPAIAALERPVEVGE